MKTKTVADEAKALVFGDRRNAYHHPLDDYSCTAQVVNALLAGKLKEDLTPEDLQMVMIAVKLSRLSRNLDHRDSLVDIIGYSLCIEETQLERNRRANSK